MNDDRYNTFGLENEHEADKKNTINAHLDLMGTFSVAVPLQIVSMNEPLWKAIVNEQTQGADAIQMQAACKGINPEEMN